MKQVKINVPDGYELKQEGNTYTVVEKEEFKLEVGKDYVSKKNKEEIIIDRKGDYDNVCFFKGEFVVGIACLTTELWKKATEEEVIEAFEKECVRRYGEDWREIKIKECMRHGVSEYMNGELYETILEKEEKGWEVWNENGCLYRNGKWAEKLEEPKFAESLEEVDRPWYLSEFGEVEEVSGEVYQDKNHLPTEGLTEGLLALTQLLSFRHDVWEKEGKPSDFSKCFGIKAYRNGISVTEADNINHMFRFKKLFTARWFLETHKKLLTEYYNKLIK